MKLKAVRTSLLLSLLFLCVYGTANYLTSLRAGVGSFYFQWERHIPFIPAMIVPYMSIDLFFIAAPFFCRDDRERQTLSRRIVAAILICGACFLLFPLRFAFDRPAVGGWLGAIFNSFRDLDRPFNQFPSLHITLRTVLAGFYAAHTRAPLRWMLAVWFSLIGFSTVLTYQHHVIDLIGGFALAALCLHFWQEVPLRQLVTPNRRVGAYYAAGAIAVAAVSPAARPWTLVLLWPAMSLALMSAGYFVLGPGIFRKAGGRLPLTTWLFLWPVLLGQRLSLVYYSRQCRAWDALTDHLWIGRRLSRAEAQQAVAQGVTAVLDLTGELSESAPFRALAYRQLPVLDLTAPTPAQLQEAIAFIQQHAAGIIYVHCKIGYSRTAAAAGAFLLETGQAATADEAMAQLRAVRPTIIIRPEAVAALEAWQMRADLLRAKLT